MRTAAIWLAFFAIALLGWVLGSCLAWASPVPLRFTAPCTDAPPAHPDTACGLTSGAPPLTGLSHAMVYVVRFNPGDTLALRIDLQGRECQDIAFDLDVAPGTMGYAWVTSVDFAGNESCRSTTTLFAVPLTAFAPGLWGVYYDNDDLTGFKLTRADPMVSFEWGTESPDSLVEPDTFSCRWTGKIRASATGVYSFCADKDDGARLWIGTAKVFEEWAPSRGKVCGTTALQAGLEYDLALEYFEGGGDARIQFLWTPPGGSEVRVPVEALSH